MSRATGAQKRTKLVLCAEGRNRARRARGNAQTERENTAPPWRGAYAVIYGVAEQKGAEVGESGLLNPKTLVCTNQNRGVGVGAKPCVNRRRGFDTVTLSNMHKFTGTIGGVLRHPPMGDL